MIFSTQLKKENLAVKQAPLAELAQYQADLQAGKFDLLVLNPNQNRLHFRKNKLYNFG